MGLLAIRSTFVLIVILSMIVSARGESTVLAPVPGEKEQNAARKRVLDLYAEDFRKTEEKFQRELVDRLRAQARADANDPAMRYMLLRMAFDKAMQARDVQSGMSIAIELGQAFDMEWRPMLIDAVTRAGPTWKLASSNERLTRLCFIVAGGAIARDEYDAAAMVLHTARIAVRKSQNLADAAEVEQRTKRLQTMKAEHEKYRMAIKRLERAPDDPAANLAAGRYLCFVRGNWADGLPMLARGTDTTFKDLAERDVDAPESAEDRKSLADAWWDASATQADLIRIRQRQRAAHWYRQALAELETADADVAHARLSEVQAMEDVDSRRPKDAVQYEGHHYLLLNLHADWLLAKHLCEEMGGHLVCIGSERENQFLVSLMTAAQVNEAHIGLSDEAEEGSWTWVNGEPWVFARWDARQPDGGRRQNFGLLRSNGRWDDTGGGPIDRAFICEWPKKDEADMF